MQEEQKQEQQQEQQQQQQVPEKVFVNISGDNDPVVIESVCTECEESGNTTIMLITIPMFKELVLTSFNCDHCGNKNSNVEFGGKIGDFATNISLNCTSLDDFKRDVVKSEFSSISIPELDFEIPPNKKGSVNTIEGFFKNTIEDLESDQEKRKLLWPDLYKQIDTFIIRLQEILEGKHFPFHFVIDDKSGNSFIKNPFAPKLDKNLKITERVRTYQDCVDMGFSPENETYEKEVEELEKKLKEKIERQKKEGIICDEQEKNQQIHHKIDYTQPFDEENAKKESLSFPITCHCCMKEGQNKMCIIDIPYFKEVTIMSFNCEYCGTKNCEVKCGGGISDKGVRITLDCEGDRDLKRDLFKSDTCGVIIPHLDIELDHGTLGGVYTTVEGLLEKISDNLTKNNPFADSDKAFQDKIQAINRGIKELREGKTKFTLILEDMLENSFIQNPDFPKEDYNCKSEKFERTEDMNEILGLNDMKV